MKNLEYYTDDNIEMVRESFSIDDMLSHLLEFGLLNKISSDYCDNVLDMCNNCCVILGRHLSIYVRPEDIKVCEGVFNMMGNHTWINIDGIIFDTTLAQFIPSAPRLAILKECEQYQVLNEWSLPNWIKLQI